jgi:hypothetical protein
LLVLHTKLWPGLVLGLVVATRAHGQPPQPTPQQPLAAPLAAPAPVTYQAVPVTTCNRTYVLGPGPICSSLSWLGQRTANLGQTHVWQVQHSRFRPAPAPLTAQSASGGAMIYMLVPVSQSQAPASLAAPVYRPEREMVPAPIIPSLQSAPVK